MNIRKYDVVVVGAGAAGLMTAQKLSQLGMSVALIEQKPTVASGPSTRNEGWLHRGTYHAASIRDRSSALQVAQRCIYGHEQLKTFAPEAIEDSDKKPIAMLKNGERLDDLLSRWKEAEVRYKEISHRAVASLVPGIDVSRAAALFEVNDVSINTRLLYRKLVGTARVSGCVIFVAHKIVRCDNLTLELEGVSGEILRISGQRIVYTTGAGTKSLFATLHNVEIPIRCWKSHLLVTKRLAPMGVFYLDAHEAAMMHHGDVSIIGFNEDAALCDAPGYEVIPERAGNLRKGIGRIIPRWRDTAAVDIACVKVDLVEQGDAARSLNVAIREPVPGHIVALPGKLTETPYLADALVAMIHNDVEDGLISDRPCDRYAAASLLSEAL